MKELEIYIHIPFCIRKCYYCDFLSSKGDKEVINQYVLALNKEIQLYKEFLKERCITTVFIGGGTPSILEPWQIESIFDNLKSVCNFNNNCEITIECNPGTITLDKALMYKKVGINRISIGLQSANNNDLKNIGRIHRFEDFISTYEIFRNEGFDNINVDIMSALPYQTNESYIYSLNKIVSLKPEHISSYSLILEENTRLFDFVEDKNKEGIEILPNEEDERQMYYDTEKILMNNGYKHYEISNYSLKGKECKHNIGYWKRIDYIGFGIGAASLIDDKRYTNINNREKYIRVLNNESYKNKDMLIENIELLNLKASMEEFMFLGLRMIEGIDVDEFKIKFNKDIFKVYGNIIKKLHKLNLIVLSNNRLMLTEKGIDVSNCVLAEFLL